MSEALTTLRQKADQAIANARRCRARGESGEAEFWTGVQCGLLSAMHVIKAGLPAPLVPDLSDEEEAEADAREGQHTAWEIIGEGH